MRDKLIAIILEAQGFRPYYCIRENIDRIFEWDILEHSGRMYEQAKMIADALIAAGVTVQEWVSVEDALPEKAGEYLVAGWHFRGEKPCVWLCEFAFLGGTLGGWCNNAKNPMVRAWMPLPALPREE